MSITTCQKVTLISCSVLCVSLFLPRMLLPRGKKEMEQPEGKAAYQIIIHPSISILLHLHVFFFSFAMLLLLFPAVALTVQIERGLGPHHCTQMFIIMLHNGKEEQRNMHFIYTEDFFFFLLYLYVNCI